MRGYWIRQREAVAASIFAYYRFRLYQKKPRTCHISDKRGKGKVSRAQAQGRASNSRGRRCLATAREQPQPIVTPATVAAAHAHTAPAAPPAGSGIAVLSIGGFPLVSVGV